VVFHYSDVRKTKILKMTMSYFASVLGLFVIFPRSYMAFLLNGTANEPVA
jgi:hypothetical protein